MVITYEPLEQYIVALFFPDMYFLQRFHFTDVCAILFDLFGEKAPDLCTYNCCCCHFTDHLQGVFEDYDKLCEMVSPSLPVKYSRTPGYRPQPKDNEYNAW